MRSQARVWFYRPQLYWFGKNTLLPWYFGSDELGRSTLAVGWTVTGRMVIALTQGPAGRMTDMKQAMLEVVARWMSVNDPCGCPEGAACDGLKADAGALVDDLLDGIPALKTFVDDGPAPGLAE